MDDMRDVELHPAGSAREHVRANLPGNGFY